MATRHLTIRAGKHAAERLRAEGFHPELFGTLVGASGGPKWLVLRHLDAVLIDRLIAPRSTPLDTLGSSIGSFRHACFAQLDPRAALARFATGYIEQSYDPSALDRRGLPSMEAITLESDRILGLSLGEKGADEICDHPLINTHIVAARLQNDRGYDRGLPFQLQVGYAALANAFSRRALGRSFERLVFRSGASPLAYSDLPTENIDLTPERVQHALLASGSIPLLMQGVRSTPGVPGTLFDGGIIDYHFDFEWKRREGLVLFQHFFDKITPGWFDKPWKSRRPSAVAMNDVVMIAPSDAFVAALPGGKIPDRDDFMDFSTEERVERWHAVVEACRVLGKELEELIESDGLADRVEPFPA